MSIGFSDSEKMVGADAVVGLPDDMDVVEYDLDSQVMNHKSSAVKSRFPTVLEFSKSGSLDNMHEDHFL